MILIIALFLFLGIQLSQFTPFQISNQNTIPYGNGNEMDVNKIALELNDQMVENFQNVSSSSDVQGGASTIYKWAVEEPKGFNLPFPEIPDIKLPDIKIPEVKLPPMPKVDVDIPKLKFPKISSTKSKKKKEDECVVRGEEEEVQPSNIDLCRQCDITLNKDIDKYVLKSSIPPQPNMNDYIEKSLIPPQPDMSQYILRNEIPACPSVDMSQYIKRSDVKCPKAQCKTIQEFNIIDHPDMKEYVKRSDILNSDEVKKYIKDNFVKKDQCGTKGSEISGMMGTKVSCPKCPKCPLSSKCPKCGSSGGKQWNTGSNIKQPEGLYVGDSLFASVV